MREPVSNPLARVLKLGNGSVNIGSIDPVESMNDWY